MKDDENIHLDLKNFFFDSTQRVHLERFVTNKFNLPNDEFKRLSFDLALRLAELDGVKIRLEALLLLLLLLFVVEDICL
jgi:hypothetical protein